MKTGVTFDGQEITMDTLKQIGKDLISDGDETGPLLMALITRLEDERSKRITDRAEVKHIGGAWRAICLDNDFEKCEMISGGLHRKEALVEIEKEEYEEEMKKARLDDLDMLARLEPPDPPDLCGKCSQNDHSDHDREKGWCEEPTESGFCDCRIDVGEQHGD